jgi:hypothetical protein
MFVCPVCGYPEMEAPPEKYAICPSCGTEFGYSDAARSYAELRAFWRTNGMKWWAQWMPAPANWNPRRQLAAVIGQPVGEPDKGSASSTVRTEPIKVLHFTPRVAVRESDA